MFPGSFARAVIVADASLIACFVIRDERSEWADAVCAADPVWVAPLLWRSEVRDTLAKYIEQAGMELEVALLAMQSADEIIGGREYAVDSKVVLELAQGSRCTACDCEYVALAQ